MPRMEDKDKKESPRSESINWGERLVLSWGKLRRFYLLSLRRGYVEKSLKRRIGECSRSGACCNLMFPCPLIGWLERLPTCGIYQNRPRNCTAFPIDERDLRDRDILNPWEPCGFSFRHAEKADGGTEEPHHAEGAG